MAFINPAPHMTMKQKCFNVLIFHATKMTFLEKKTLGFMTCDQLQFTDYNYSNFQLKYKKESRYKRQKWQLTGRT